MLKKKNNSLHQYTVPRGRIFCLDPADEPEELGLVLVVSNELHNQFSSHLVVVLVTDKNVEKVRPSLEIPCQMKGKKMKILTSHLHTISREIFYRIANYLGILDEDTMLKVNERIRSILDLG